MVRGTFANIRLKNLLTPGEEGGITVHLPDQGKMSVFDAAQEYAKTQTPLIVIAGREYGTGSSRDWAAKGTRLLGVCAVIAASFERIHRANLAGMGILPLEFMAGQTASALGLTGRETYEIGGLGDISPRKTLAVKAKDDSGQTIDFKVTARLDTASEVECWRAGGVLPAVLRDMVLKAKAKRSS